MKKILLAGLMLFAVDAQAAEDKLDLVKFASRFQASYVYNNHGDSMAGAHFKAVEYPKGDSWAALNAGLIWNLTGDQKKIGGGFFSVTFEIDRVAGWAWKKSGAADRFKINFKVPSASVGPFAGYVQRLGWLYGIHIAKGFGG